MEWITYESPYLRIKGYEFAGTIDVPYDRAGVYDEPEDMEFTIVDALDSEGNGVEPDDLPDHVLDTMKSELYRWWLEDAE